MKADGQTARFAVLQSATALHPHDGDYYQFPAGYKHFAAAPVASFLVFTTPFNVRTGQADALVPLYRLSMKCNKARKHFYATNDADRNTWANGPQICSAGAGPGDQGYYYDGIEGYVLPPTASPPAQWPTAQRLFRKYSLADKAWALVMEPEESLAAYVGYNTGRTLLGYVIPFVAYSGNPAVATIRDADGDRLFDALENFLGTHPNNADSDGDGIIDGLEYSLHRESSDPLRP